MRNTFQVLVFVLAGLLCGLVVDGFRRPSPLAGDPDIHRQDLHLQRQPDQPLLVEPAKWLRLPWLAGDFDLRCELELGDATELDLVLRCVEPRPLRGERRPTHGRFVVLRLSTQQAGDAFRDREGALFGPDGGVLLAPGVPATIWVTGRGRQLQANVAGRRLPAFEATDEHGSFAMIARGGTAAVRSLDIELRSAGVGAGLLSWLDGRRMQWPLFGAFVGLFAALAAFAGGARPVRGAFAAAMLPLFTLAGCRIVLGGALPLLEPEPLTLLCLLVVGLPPAIELAVNHAPARWWGLLVMLPGVLLPLGIAHQLEAPRSAASAALDAVFGPDAGEQVLEAHARRVRGPFGVHTPEPCAHRVFLLGGQLLYDRGQPDEHLEPLLLGELHQRLQVAAKDIDVPCLPTVDGHAAQQWRLFTSCFAAAYRPQVIVFGVARDEAAVDPRTGQARSGPAHLRSVLAAAQAHCAQHGAKLVLLADEGLGNELRRELLQVAQSGVPLVTIEPGTRPQQIARDLAAAIAPLLR